MFCSFLHIATSAGYCFTREVIGFAEAQKAFAWVVSELLYFSCGTRLLLLEACILSKIQQKQLIQSATRVQLKRESLSTSNHLRSVNSSQKVENTSPRSHCQGRLSGAWRWWLELYPRCSFECRSLHMRHLYSLLIPTLPHPPQPWQRECFMPSMADTVRASREVNPAFVALLSRLKD